ncbi:class I SAM-dependent methyltransferase [Priestia aryabhattai]
MDYGCGYGRTLSELKKQGYHNLYGVDFSKEMIKRAQLNSGDIQYSVINSGLLRFADNSFDSVLLFAVLTCVYTD